MLAAGYDEMVERKWEPSAMADTHTHPFEANAIVPRAGAYSAAGTMYWLARKNVAAARCL